ncbi:hypothetical protein K9L16_01680 [Candidatus Pacearchaeota archaeon]|nr:hypothetical protein [Candidatus Pacearchaeota archaeon]
MNSDYKKGLQKAITECKKLHKECIEYMRDCPSCPHYTKECLSEWGVFDELIIRLEKLKN